MKAFTILLLVALAAASGVIYEGKNRGAQVRAEVDAEIARLGCTQTQTSSLAAALKALEKRVAGIESELKEAQSASVEQAKSADGTAASAIAEMNNVAIEQPKAVAKKPEVTAIDDRARLKDMAHMLSPGIYTVPKAQNGPIKFIGDILQPKDGATSAISKGYRGPNGEIADYSATIICNEPDLKNGPGEDDDVYLPEVTVNGKTYERRVYMCCWIRNKTCKALKPPG